MSESFAELLEESLKDVKMRPGAIVDASIEGIEDDWVTVYVGLKSEGVIPLEQFQNEDGEITVSVGDKVQVALDAVEDGFGETKVSREKAKRMEAWGDLETAFEKSSVVTGIITGKVKGGFTVDINGVRAFLPGSLVDVRSVRDTTHLEGKELEFKVIKLDQKRSNVVISRRSVLEAENGAEREQLLSNLEEGMEVNGVVKNLTDYGSFVDLGGIDGLLHITDMAWKRIKHPSEIVKVGQELTVKILKFDRERNRVSLGLKQLTKDPWAALAQRFVEGAKLKGCVTNVTDYGCFVELEDGVEGLVHVSEMDWTNKNVHPSKVVSLGEEVEVQVLDVDEERRRISLGLKQCQINPWAEFFRTHSKDNRVTGKIKSITDFGIFIGLEGGIDGLVHLSDISWNESGEDAVRRYSKGEEVEAVVLAIDAERERISLGIKQIVDDPYITYISMNEKGAIVNGVVKEVTASLVTVELAEEVLGVLKASELDVDRVPDATNVVKVGDTIESRIISIDRKNRTIALSVKAKNVLEEKEALEGLRSQKSEVNVGATTIGDLIKAQINEGSKEKG